MGITPLRFTGISTFSDDFQAVVDRAVSIASLPLVEMQNDQADLLSRKNLLGGLSSVVGTLAAKVEALGALGQSKAVGASSSDTSKVTVTAADTAAPGVYTITDITSVASAASATSAAGYATADAAAVSSDGVLELVVGYQSYTVDLTAEGKNNLNGLRDAINALGAGVTATVLNTGTGETPYYLSLSSDSTGRRALELRETAGQAAANLLANAPSSTEAVYSTNSGYDTRDAEAVSADGSMQLVVGGVKYAVDVSGANHLDGLRDAINALGAGVTAAVVDTGAASGRYRLTVTAAGGQAVRLEETADDPSSNVLTNAHLGSDASFSLNGLAISRSDNAVSGVVAGVTFNILDTTSPGEEIVVSLASNRGDLATALSGLVSAYNAVVDAINAQMGENAGMLTGDSIIREVQTRLRELTSYRGSGAVATLFDLGIEMDSTGKMSFDSDVFYALPNSDIAAAFTFLGSTSSGFGALHENFAQISDPISGLIQVQLERYDEADSRLEEQIASLTDRIDAMQTSLLARLQQADVLLASLESQQTMLDASIESLKLVLFGRNDK
jgi:flagellar hook-associated protein 2